MKEFGNNFESQMIARQTLLGLSLDYYWTQISMADICPYCHEYLGPTKFLASNQVAWRILEFQCE